jgi:hypothetical protein
LTLEAVAGAAEELLVGFDVVDVLDGFATLDRRSPTLGGSVPLRVAQACVPLLEGNAWGHQITLHRRIELRRRFGAWSAVGIERGDELARLMRAGVPVLAAGGMLRGDWLRRLERGVIDTRGKLSVFTGLFVRPRAGLRLRQSSTANRRSVLFSVEEAILDDGDGFCPVVLDLVPAAGVDALALDGEVATLAVLPARVAFGRCGLDDAPEVARGHVRFYDAGYFETKQRGQVSRKYRDEIARRDPSSPSAEAGVDALVVEAGPALVEPAPPARFHRAAGAIRAPSGTPPDRLVIANAVGFSAMFDGYRVTVTPDAGQLASHAAEVRARWQRWLAGAGVASHEGALLYLTRYFTPHPPGEPHFFVKPSALIRTPAGVSAVLDGRCGAGYDVLRGVVRSDAFHAAPAVFQLWQPGRTIELAAGAPLLELFPCPRALFDATFALRAGGIAAASWSA